MAKITAPVAEFTGKRGSVAFVDGVGETDDVNMLTYFKRHGYTVEDEAPVEPAAEPAPAEPTASGSASAAPAAAAKKS